MPKTDKEINFRLPAIEIKLSEDNKPPEWVQILKVGSFEHPDYGTITITKDVLLKLKENFDNKIRGIDLAFDYKHESDDIASGWFKEVELRDNDTTFWVRTEWTPAGEQKLSDKEFRYTSADFTLDYTSNENKKKYGPTLFGAALTNRPFIKNMVPVVQLNEKEKPNGGLCMDDKDKKIEELTSQLKAAMDKLAALQQGDTDATMKELKDKNAEMEKALGEYKEKDLKAQADQKLAEKKGKFDIMLKEGKTVEAQREAFMKDDMMKFTELAQPMKLKEAGHGGAGDGGGTAGETAADKIQKLAEAKMKDDKKLTLSEAISSVMKTEKALALEYRKEMGA